VSVNADRVAIEITFPDLTLSVSEVWPDKDAPAEITADAVLAVMRKHGSLRRVIDDWNLIDELNIVVTVDNPAWGQSEALIPELAPERWITTEATFS